MRCADARVDLSARLDGELDDDTIQDLESHLGECSACRQEEESLRAARRAVRIQPVEQVPDLTRRIMDAVENDGPRLRNRSEWAARFKVATVAAAISALVLAGASLPRSSGEGDVASAGEITSAVSSAARSLAGYRASYDIVERGWNPKVPERHFSAELWFQAPEKLRMLVSDFTPYPGEGWPRNNVELVASPRRWSIEEPTEWQCPLSALRPCALRAQTPSESRTIVDRQPFDGASHLPTDLIVPLETLVSSRDFRVVGVDTVAGRPTYELELSYGSAIPLVDALETGGSWRPFSPLDRVRLWIDTRTWFPLQFEVTASARPERELWAEQQGLRDRAGETLLSVTAASFSTASSFPAETFEVPSRGLVKSGGFHSDASRAPWAAEPRYLAGLDPYRSGTPGNGQWVDSYTRGMTWLKVTSRRLHPPKPFYPPWAEELELAGTAGIGYYQPSSVSLGRRVDVFTDRIQVHLESNLPRVELLKVAASLGISGRAGPYVTNAGPYRVFRIEDDDPYGRSSYALEPQQIPAGYELASATLARVRGGRSTLTTYYAGRESDYSESGLRIVQSEPVRALTPSSRDFLRVMLDDGTEARWAPDTGRLEWIDTGVYRAVTVPFADLSTALTVARSLH